MRRNLSVLLACCTGLFLFSCKSHTEMPLSGQMYQISFADGSGTGFGMFEGVGDQERTGTYYADKGQLYAENEAVTVRSSRKGCLMVFPDGSEKGFSFKSYHAPAYQELPEVKHYRDSVYTVAVEKDVLYGNAKGYWTSYPEVCGQSFTDIYLARYGAILDGMEDCALTMDIYQPEGAGHRPHPLFLMIHGGAFYYEDKADPEYAAWCRHFAALGYVAASINYRMGFALTKGEAVRAGYRALQDSHAAIRYLVGRKDLSIDPERVFVAGNSAGAITALNLAFLREADKPYSARGGRILHWVNNLFGTSIRDMGPINAVNPADTTGFSIRAVANMWGAVMDPDILQNAKVAIVSFHSENDPTVPFGYDYPFKDYIQEELFEAISQESFLGRTISWLGLQEKVNHAVFDKMYGSRYIDQKARDLGYPSKLYKYTDNRHSLHVDANCHPLHFFEIEHRMADFFSDEMETCPVNLHRENDGWVRIDPSQVKRCFWKVEGGVVLETKPDGIRVLLFPDVPDRAVTVQGEYLSKATFKERLPL